MTHAIDSFLDRNFVGCSRATIRSIVERVKSGALIPAGTLVLMASGDSKIRLRVLEKDTPNKGFSQPLALNEYARSQRLTPNYLLWYLDHGEVREYLLSVATGVVFLRVQRDDLYGLPVPLPRRRSSVRKTGEVVIEGPDSPFSRVIGELYSDYLHNLSAGRFRTAIILAGAIAEVLIYQMLLEQDVSQKVLRDDRSLALGKMLAYVKLLKLDHGHFPMTHLAELQKKRNSAIHAGEMIRSKATFSKSDLQCFDHIVKHFGL